MSPAERFLLPDLGEGLTDAELVRWQVDVGEAVELNQPLCEVETAKALVELPSPFAGTVVALLVAEGDTARVGDALIEIAGRPGPAEAPEPPAAADAGLLVGTGPLAHRPSRLRRADYPPGRGGPSTGHSRPSATPAARKLAEELGIDLADVASSGATGVITPDEVRSAAPAGARESRIPIRGVRRAMAEAVALSARTVPQVTEFLTVDVTASMDLLRELRGDAAYRGVKLTPLTLVALSLLAALPRHPELNSSWDAQAQEVIEKHYVNLGIAVASPRGLIVPNIKDADRLRLGGLARAIEELAGTARAGATAPADLAGGTISITNIGVFGIDTGTPILNPGEAAILCLGAVAQRPWVHRDAVAVRQVTTLGLTFDHRLADGAQASRFLAAVGAGLENPLRLLG